MDDKKRSGSHRILSIDAPGRIAGGYAFWQGVAIATGPINFDRYGPEADDYRVLDALIDLLSPTLIVLEHPFIFEIALHVGAIKMKCAQRHIPWWMVGASKAKKLVIGYGRASKTDVLAWARQHLNNASLDQHQSDAALYLEAWRLDQSMLWGDSESEETSVHRDERSHEDPPTST